MRVHPTTAFQQETSAIKEAFAGVVGGLSSIVAQQVQVTLRCHARLKDASGHRHRADLGKNDIMITTYKR